jgi:CMP-N,N'-diacetyllegionaminic acid synthase
MIDGKSILAIIPARGGSKGLPRKNILPLGGKPLIAWTIDAAKDSEYIDELILSSDDDEIISIAKKYGCNVPFKRPKRFATDESNTIDVLVHSIQFFKNRSIGFDYLVLLEPTSPLRKTIDIDSAIKLLNQNRSKADSIVGVSKVEDTHPVFDVRVNNEGLISPFIGDSFKVIRRQDIEDLYYFEGSVYVSDIQVLLEEKSFYHERTMPFIIPRWKALEIDEMIDMITAEAIIQNLSLIKGVE